MESTAESAPQRIEFPRFGGYSYTESEVLNFPWGLPGFAELRRFVLLQVQSQPHFVWLQSLDDTTVALPLASPWTFFEDYDPKIPLYAQAALRLERPEDHLILCVVVVRDGGGSMTMNLLAPVIVNQETRTGRQVMLDDARYAVRTPLPPVEPAT